MGCPSDYGSVHWVKGLRRDGAVEDVRRECRGCTRSPDAFRMTCSLIMTTQSRRVSRSHSRRCRRRLHSYRSTRSTGSIRTVWNVRYRCSTGPSGDSKRSRKSRRLWVCVRVRHPWSGSPSGRAELPTTDFSTCFRRGEGDTGLWVVHRV